MSAICGIVDFHQPPAAADLETMLFMLAHRGQRDPGVYVHRCAVIGHWDSLTLEDHRLAPQPWRDAAAGIVVAADARIDNREELLPALGLPAGSEPEILANGRRRWGAHLFERLVGDFAAAIWDETRCELLLARDPPGVKPLYYGHLGTRLLFATEAKAILAVPGVRTLPHPRRLEEMRQRRFRFREPAFFEGIRRVWPGESIRFNREGISRDAFWSPELRGRLRYASSGDYQSEFRRLFLEAVRCRLPDRGPAGILLSGGMDSSSIACAAGSLRAEKPNCLVRTYTHKSAQYSDPLESTDEVAQSTGFQRSFVETDGLRLTDDLPTLVFQQESPLIDFESAFYRQTFRQAVRQGTRILLNGSAGDELMQTRAYLADLFLQGRWIRLLREIAGIRSAFGPLWGNFMQYALWYLLLPRRNTPRFRSRSAREVYEGVLEPFRLIHREALDHQAAHCGVELRYPFLDLRLVNFVLSIPGEERIHNGVQKRLLREGLADLVPLSVRTRAKRLDDLPHSAAAFARSGLVGGTLAEQSASFEALVARTWRETWFRPE